MTIPIPSLPSRLVFNIIEKMKLVSLCRTRQTCRVLDKFVEDNRFSITKGSFADTNLHISVSQESFKCDAFRNLHDQTTVTDPYIAFSAINFHTVLIQFTHFFDLDDVIDENQAKTKTELLTLLRKLRVSCEVLQFGQLSDKDSLEFLSIVKCNEIRVDFGYANFSEILAPMIQKGLHRINFYQSIFLEDFPETNLFEYVNGFQAFRLCIDYDQSDLAENALCNFVNAAEYYQHFTLEELCFHMLDHTINPFSIFKDVKLVWTNESNKNFQIAGAEMPNEVYLIRRAELIILISTCEETGITSFRMMFIKEESQLHDYFMKLFPVLFAAMEGDFLTTSLQNAYDSFDIHYEYEYEE